MIQRYSEVKNTHGFRIANAHDRPLLRHPQLASLALEAIASWSNVEAYLLKMFVQLVGGNDTLAADIYLSLAGDGPKKAAINTAAESMLDQAHLDVFQAILEIADINSKARHKLAHWTWGDSDGLPDALLLVDPRAMIKNLVDSRDVYVYREADFRQIIDANDRLCGYTQLLQAILEEHPTNADGRLFQRLSWEPEIEERLNRQKARRARLTPAAPLPQPPAQTSP